MFARLIFDYPLFRIVCSAVVSVCRGCAAAAVTIHFGVCASYLIYFKDSGICVRRVACSIYNV